MIIVNNLLEFIWGEYLGHKYIYNTDFLGIMYSDWGNPFSPTGCFLDALGGRKNIITTPKSNYKSYPTNYIKFLIVN